MTIKEALALRAEIKSHRTTNKPLSKIVTEILSGTYDKFKDEAETAALEDYDFLTAEDKEWKIKKNKSKL